MPQRMIDNPFLLKLESGGLIHRLFVALSSAWRWRAHTGMSIAHMAKTFFAAVREGDGAIQTMMAANAPVLIQRAMVEGRPRSEEHTSELQSLMRISYAVFCLKKKKKQQTSKKYK